MEDEQKNSASLWRLHLRGVRTIRKGSKGEKKYLREKPKVEREGKKKKKITCFFFSSRGWSYFKWLCGSKRSHQKADSKAKPDDRRDVMQTSLSPSLFVHSARASVVNSLGKRGPQVAMSCINKRKRGRYRLESVVYHHQLFPRRKGAEKKIYRLWHWTRFLLFFVRLLNNKQDQRLLPLYIQFNLGFYKVSVNGLAELIHSTQMSSSLWQ